MDAPLDMDQFSEEVLDCLRAAPEDEIVCLLGDLITGPRTRKLLKTVLDIPVMVKCSPPLHVSGGMMVIPDDYAWKGGFGEHEGELVIFINNQVPEDLRHTLLHEAQHAIRHRTGRDICNEPLEWWEECTMERRANRMADYLLGVIPIAEERPGRTLDEVMDAWFDRD
jgi:hypothetical protein